MEQYTILLVDDEEEVIQVIMRKIDWEGLGFSVIGYANNGVKAWELVEEHQPDVVVTDIRMPYMDGLELSKKIKTEYPATKVLLFTGFDEFEYAKEAVHLEVEEYILKPLNAMELTGVFTKLKEKLDREISEKRNTEILQKYYLESLPLMQTNFYSSLIEGKISEEKLDRYLKNYQIMVRGPYYCCLVVHTSSSRMPADMNPVLVGASVQKHAQERFEKRWNAKSFSYLGDTVLLTELKSESDVSDLTDEADRFCRYMQRVLGAYVTIGVGQVQRKLTEVLQSYEGAREAVSYRVIYGVSRAINIREIAPKEMLQAEEMRETDLGGLFKAIRMSSEADVQEEVSLCMERLTEGTNTLQQYHIAVVELVTELYRFSINNDIVTEEFSGDVRKLYDDFLNLDPEGIRTWLLGISLSFHEKMIRARSQSSQSFVFRAKEYVKSNYAQENLSLDLVCEVLGVSNSYFSTTFKKETGDSFIGYVTNYRMEHAARLLIETGEKSLRIARQVGYTDPNYFSYVFKRRYGVSPSKYRTEHVEREAENS